MTMGFIIFGFNTDFALASSHDFSRERRSESTASKSWAANGNVIREYRMFVTCENSDDLPYIRAASRRRLSDHRNDYGHTDTPAIWARSKMFKDRTDLAPELKLKIQSNNARALYGL